MTGFDVAADAYDRFMGRWSAPRAAGGAAHVTAAPCCAERFAAAGGATHAVARSATRMR